MFLAGDDPVDGLKFVADNIDEHDIEVDVAALSGPAFDSVDAAHTGMSMLASGLAKVVLFDKEGQMRPPSEVLRKRPLIIRRVAMSQPLVANERVMEMAIQKFLSEELVFNPIPDIELPDLAIILYEDYVRHNLKS